MTTDVSSYGDTEAMLADLDPALSSRVSRSVDVRRVHGSDESWHTPVAPDAVLFPESTEEVAAIVRACAAHRVPVIPFGAGTSLEGGVAALHGGISLDLSAMNRIVEVNDEDLDCVVQAGVHRIQLNEYLGPRGLFFPIDPGADATIGGMTATRASGTNAVRYGTMRDNVLAVTAVMANGDIVRTSSRARKSSAGYDLTRLMVGSEGTLGIITEVTLRLYGIPETIAAAVCSFESLEGAVQTVIETIQLGIPVARMELLDELQINASNAYSGLDLAEKPTLFLEYHGTEAAVAEQASQVRELAAGNGSVGWEWTADETERARLWKARHDAFYADLAVRPGARGMPTDVCVPISRLAEAILETRRDLDESGVWSPIVGHVGDGNFHLIFLLDPDDPDEVKRYQEVHHRLVRRALAMGGTCTGEHGIGHGKLEYMVEEHGRETIDVMRAIKRALDPDNIMNPGKVVPPPPAS
jgi:D-lactate dehydrogenase (cytochrome)